MVLDQDPKKIKKYIYDICYWYFDFFRFDLA